MNSPSSRLVTGLANARDPPPLVRLPRYRIQEPTHRSPGHATAIEGTSFVQNPLGLNTAARCFDLRHRHSLRKGERAGLSGGSWKWPASELAPGLTVGEFQLGPNDAGAGKVSSPPVEGAEASANS